MFPLLILPDQLAKATRDLITKIRDAIKSPSLRLQYFGGCSGIYHYAYVHRNTVTHVTSLLELHFLSSFSEHVGNAQNENSINLHINVSKLSFKIFMRREYSQAPSSTQH